MNIGPSLADRAQAALGAWMHALRLWNEALPPSSLTASSRDPGTGHSEVVDVLYRRWRALAQEVAAPVERRDATSAMEESPWA